MEQLQLYIGFYGIGNIQLIRKGLLYIASATIYIPHTRYSQHNALH